MKYEMLYLIDSAVAEEARDGMIAKFEDVVKNLGGTVLSTDKWGMKKLAYPINYKTEGYYVLTTFAAASELPRELERNLNNDEGILRFLVVRQNG